MTTTAAMLMNKVAREPDHRRKSAGQGERRQAPGQLPGSAHKQTRNPGFVETAGDGTRRQFEIIASASSR